MKKGSEFIRQQYKSAMHGKSELDKGRAIEYAFIIKLTAILNGLDEERWLYQCDWESAFVNNIRDRKLPFKSWSYGISGIQVQVAREWVKGIQGRQLITDYALNIQLGAQQMGRLKKLCKGNSRKAEMAYNVGYPGVMAGKKTDYSECLDAVEKRYKKFQGE